MGQSTSRRRYHRLGKRTGKPSDCLCAAFLQRRAVGHASSCPRQERDDYQDQSVSQSVSPTSRALPEKWPFHKTAHTLER
jgi:hypothetical protein